MCFTFMQHDKWANVLFLHWAVPSHLEPVLQDQCGGGAFALDCYDVKAYVGLILLTEQNVWPAVGRDCCKRFLVTHHGVNVRTYVRGVEGRDHRHDDNLRGIHFSSLECDDFVTSYGANFFGMPYRITSIERTFGLRESTDNAHKSDASAGECEALIRQDALSPKEADDIMCNENGQVDRTLRVMRLRSVRAREGAEPSLLHGASGAHSTRISFESDGDDKRSTSSTPDDGYAVACEWERSEQPLTEKERTMADFFVERYHVYTQKYGLHWSGTVSHEPWPVEMAKLRRLEIANTDAYEPAAMRPIIWYMSETEPDSVLFSRGVGPINFQMLRPV